MWKLIKPRNGNLWLWQLGLLVLLFVFWHVMTAPGLIPPMMFDNDRQAAFFFGEPLKMAERIWAWFVVDADIYQHLAVTLAETLMAFAIGCRAGPGRGPVAGAQPHGVGHSGALHQGHERHATHHPGPHFFGLVRAGYGLQGGAGCDAGVFYRVFQCVPGSERKSARWCWPMPACWAPPAQLLRHVYLPSATSWVFSSLHTSVGLAFVGAVVGEYLGSSQGVGYLILQAEGSLTSTR
jgi:NitT/TauT family transport system permease protein